MTTAFLRPTAALLALLCGVACTRPDTSTKPVETPVASASAATTEAAAVVAADCRHPFGLYDNTELTYQLTDNDDKITGTQILKVASITAHAAEKKEPARTDVLLKSSLYDADNKLLSNDEFVFSCRNDSVLTDGRLLLAPDMLRSFRDRRFSYVPTALAWPNRPETGSLPNGQLTVEVRSPSVDIARVTTTVSQRQLNGREAVTTPAGVFQAYKVESKYEYATQLKPDLVRRSTLRVIDYYAPHVGIVRTEFRSDNGKLERAIVLARHSSVQ
ncbi:hypothetical protein [Hymenobacter koreensis]|uniref:DUF3108 domain-containing protein n=1 Tax=Hymenobacter koreensis TaxID=1084523 RepID=A0ABP8J8Q2_9BACT